MFLIFGLLLTLFGLAGSKDIYAHSLGININLGWGIVLLVFGGVMLLLGRRGMSRLVKAVEQVDSSTPGKRRH
jgi:hypothetical protein